MLKLSYSDYEALRAHGEETYPYRVLRRAPGNATPDGNHVKQIVRAGNTRTDRAHDRYNIAPEELIKIQRQARGLGLDIVGFFLSHPDCPAQWSKTDFDEAHWVGCSYVITRVNQGKADVTNSFLLTGTNEDDKEIPRRTWPEIEIEHEKGQA